MPFKAFNTSKSNKTKFDDLFLVALAKKTPVFNMENTYNENEAEILNEVRVMVAKTYYSGNTTYSISYKYNDILQNWISSALEEIGAVAIPNEYAKKPSDVRWDITDVEHENVAEQLDNYNELLELGFITKTKSNKEIE